MSDKNNLTDKKTTSHALAAKIILDTWLNRKQ
jgi:RNase H-fold protein (predicted Holliday junction resolvase)